jgi:glutathione S-transferase
MYRSRLDAAADEVSLFNAESERMKLYYAPGACSLSPHIVAKEAGIVLDLEKVDLKNHKTESGEDFYKINPKGYVPALKLDDGTILTEGPALVQFLADQRPELGLMPRLGTSSRYKVIEWLTFINSEIHKSFSPLFSQQSEEAKASAIEKIKKRFDYANDALSGHEFLTGATFTVADAYMFVMLTWATKMGIAVPSNLSAFYARIAKRPKVYEAMKEEHLVA